MIGKNCAWENGRVPSMTTPVHHDKANASAREAQQTRVYAATCTAREGWGCSQGVRCTGVWPWLRMYAQGDGGRVGGGGGSTGERLTRRTKGPSATCGRCGLRQ